MGLIVPIYKLESGVTVENAYVRIDTLSGNKNKLLMEVKVYFSKDASDNDLPCVYQFSKSFIPSQEEDSLRWDKQGYEYIKTLEGFEDAV